MTVSLKTLLVPSKQVEVDFPGFDGFKVQICYLSRDVLQNIRKKSTKIVMKGRTTSEEFDEELFLKLYTENTIKGWSGLKLKYLDELAPVDLGTADPESELPYSLDEALFLIKASTTFDNFISETVNDLGKFSTSNSKK